MTDDLDPLSFIKRRLRNWGAWTRIDALPVQDDVVSSIWRDYSPYKGRDAGWGSPVAPEPVALPVDPFDAERIEAGLLRIPARMKRILVGHYARHGHYDRIEIDAACRALIVVVD